MIFGKAFAIWNSCGLLAIRVKAIKSIELTISMPIMIPKLNENMMTKSEATMEIIINANSEIGSPKMTALFLMFL
jgi:hypothetical protein